MGLHHITSHHIASHSYILPRWLAVDLFYLPCGPTDDDTYISVFLTPCSPHTTTDFVLAWHTCRQTVSKYIKITYFGLIKSHGRSRNTYIGGGAGWCVVWRTVPSVFFVSCLFADPNEKIKQTKTLRRRAISDGEAANMVDCRETRFKLIYERANSIPSIIVDFFVDRGRTQQSTDSYFRTNVKTGIY